MIRFEHVSKTYDGRIDAVADFSLHIETGEFCVFIGPSGCGKSTTLRMINRLVEHDSGRILFAGEEIRSFAPETLRRRMGYAIQSIGLFPHWNVERNIATVPLLLGWPKARIAARVEELMALLQLDASLYAKAFPHQLSGGQQQRVGVARALAADPDILLMDEPFGALDPVTRTALQDELARIHRVSQKTIVLVTHDMDEALRLATRIVIMQSGRMVQAASPRDLLRQPANDFVADFIGRQDLGLRLLSVETVADRFQKGAAASNADPPLALDMSLREALSALVMRGAERAPVADQAGTIVGALAVSDIVRAA